MHARRQDVKLLGCHVIDSIIKHVPRLTTAVVDMNKISMEVNVGHGRSR